MADYTGGPGDDAHTSTDPSDQIDSGDGFDTITTDYSAISSDEAPSGVYLKQVSPSEIITGLTGEASGGGKIANVERLVVTGTARPDIAEFDVGIADIEFHGAGEANAEPNELHVDWSSLGAATVAVDQGLGSAEGHKILWTDVSSVDLKLGDGDNVITGQVPFNNDVFFGAVLGISTGKGSDSIEVGGVNLRINSGDGNDHIVVKDFTDTVSVSAGAGDDTVTWYASGTFNRYGGYDGGDGVDTLEVPNMLSADIGEYPIGSGNYLLPGYGEVFFSNFEIIQFKDRTVDLRTNAAPAISTSQNLQVISGSSQVVLLAGIDPDGDSIRYAVTGGLDADKFDIDYQGNLVFRSAPSAGAPGDTDADNIYIVNVTASDVWHNATEKELSVKVLPIPNTFSIQGVSVSENSGGAHLIIERTVGTGVAEISYTIADGTAKAGQDFQAPSDSITFAEGQTKYDLVIPIFNDTSPELTEQFTVMLKAAAGTATFTSSTATVTVVDDDKAISGTPTNDTIHGTNASEFIFGLDGVDQLYGSRGADTIFGGSGDDYVSGQEDNDELHGGSGTDGVYGGGGDDIAYGEDGADKVYGGDGSDTLFGQSGNDTLNGEQGDDKLYGGEGQDRLFGSFGNDMVYGEGDNDYINGNEGDDTLFGQEGGDTIYGEGGSDKIYGGNHTDILYGQDGDDVLYGEAEGDYLHGGSGNDVLSGGDLLDFLFGEAGNDKLYGDGGRDFLYGGDGSDLLVGGEGDDYLAGGKGKDILTGGSSKDTYAFTAGDSSLADPDKVTDFTDGADNISIGFKPTVITISGTSFANAQAAAAAAQPLIAGHTADVAVLGVGADTYLFYASNGGSMADSAVVLVGVDPGSISASDFS